MAYLVILGAAGMVPYRFTRCYTHKDLVDLRIYRASFVLALLALVVVMFSLEARPRPHTADILETGDRCRDGSHSVSSEATACGQISMRRPRPRLSALS